MSPQLFAKFMLALFLCILVCLIVLAALIPSRAKAAENCQITSCRNGGNVMVCRRKIRVEYATKLGRCGFGRLKLTSGYSSYAMATSLRGVCISRSASIYVHLPYNPKTWEQRRSGAAYRLYKSSIHPKTWAYFVAKGGLKKTNFGNAASLTRVPADKTGVKLCR